MTSNNDIFFQEIRKNAIAVQREIRSSEGTIINSLTESASALLWLSKVARHEGLLDLEMAAESERVAGLILGAELKRMLIFVSYAIDPEETAAILFKRYFSRNYEGVEGFFYLLYMDIVLKIQAGETHPYIILENIRSFMPDEVHAELDRIQEEKKNLV